MESGEFVAKCKNALIKVLKEKYQEEFTFIDLHLVWFSKTLQNFKCLIIDDGNNQRYYECTYNGNKDELYIDVYQKEHNVLFSDKGLTDEVVL